MQNAAAGRRDFLRFLVVQTADQTRIRDDARVGAEKARYVGPDFEPLRLEPGRQIRACGIRTAAPEQYSLAVRIARNETLGDQDLRGIAHAAYRFLTGSEVAARR